LRQYKYFSANEDTGVIEDSETGTTAEPDRWQWSHYSESGVISKLSPSLARGVGGEVSYETESAADGSSNLNFKMSEAIQNTYNDISYMIL
jgi:hypothetical protein